MDPQKVIQADVLDIIFEGRNKAYGAYFLRKEYEKHIKKAMIYGAIALVLAVAAPMIAKVIGDALPKPQLQSVDVELTNVLEAEKPKDEPPPPPPPKKEEPPPPPKATVKYVAPEPKRDDEVKKEDPPIPPKPDSPAISTTTQKGEDKPDPGPPPPPPPPPGGDDEGKGKVAPDEIFTVVEEAPSFGDGTRDAPLKYFMSNIKYPAIARENNIQGRVVLTFVVETDGSVSAPKLLKDVGGGCGEEALRVLKEMPKWKPGKQRNKPVRVQYTLPVSFKLAE